jgi:hypothetical protein
MNDDVKHMAIPPPHCPALHSFMSTLQTPKKKIPAPAALWGTEADCTKLHIR